MQSISSLITSISSTIGKWKEVNDEILDYLSDEDDLELLADIEDLDINYHKDDAVQEYMKNIEQPGKI